MNLNTFFKLNEKIVRILEEGYSDLTDEQRYKVSMNIQNTFIRDYINKYEKTGTREEQNDLIMQWIQALECMLMLVYGKERIMHFMIQMM